MSGLVDAALDALLADRVLAHSERAAGRLTVRAYLGELRRIRGEEADLEADRRAAGAAVSRAFELVAQEDTPTGRRARAYRDELAHHST